MLLFYGSIAATLTGLFGLEKLGHLTVNKVIIKIILAAIIFYGVLNIFNTTIKTMW